MSNQGDAHPFLFQLSPPPPLSSSPEPSSPPFVATLPSQYSVTAAAPSSTSSSTTCANPCTGLWQLSTSCKGDACNLAYLASTPTSYLASATTVATKAQPMPPQPSSSARPSPSSGGAGINGCACELNQTALTAIVVGGIFAILIFTGIAAFFGIRRYRRGQQEKDEAKAIARDGARHRYLSRQQQHSRQLVVISGGGQHHHLHHHHDVMVMATIQLAGVTAGHHHLRQQGGAEAEEEPVMGQLVVPAALHHQYQQYPHQQQQSSQRSGSGIHMGMNDRGAPALIVEIGGSGGGLQTYHHHQRGEGEGNSPAPQEVCLGQPIRVRGQQPHDDGSAKALQRAGDDCSPPPFAVSNNDVFGYADAEKEEQVDDGDCYSESSDCCGADEKCPAPEPPDTPPSTAVVIGGINANRPSLQRSLAVTPPLLLGVSPVGLMGAAVAMPMPVPPMGFVMGVTPTTPNIIPSSSAAAAGAALLLGITPPSQLVLPTPSPAPLPTIGAMLSREGTAEI